MSNIRIKILNINNNELLKKLLRSFKNQYHIECIEEKDLTAQSLINMVESLIEDASKLKKMSKAAKEHAIIDSNERIYQIIMQLIKGA
jgi:UDP-N-acetylglucosamine:LPS N-acetylglucosamine transferase